MHPLTLLTLLLPLLPPTHAAAITSPNTDPNTPTPTPTPLTYTHHKVLRVPYDAYSAHASTLAGLAETLNDSPQGAGHADILVAPENVQQVEALGLGGRVLHEDLGADLRAEESQGIEATTPSDAFFTSYHPYATHITFLASLQAAYPSRSELVSAGASYEGRNISGIHFWGSAGKGRRPAVVLHATVHAREWVTTLVNEFVAWRLLEGYEANATVRAWVDKYDFFVFPVVNPDGFMYTQTQQRLWRKNRQPNGSSGRGSSCAGTDINRNWDAGWATPGGASTDPCAEDYRGSAPGSAPETVALSAQLASVAKAQGVKLYVDWHSYSQLWMWPYGYTCSKLAANNAALESLATRAVAAIKATSGKTFTAGPICETIYAASGSSVDYVNDVVQADYVYTAELRDTGTYGFVLPADQIRPAAEEVWAALGVVLAGME
ncbi:uncharacterized protein K452DRAFT_298704 [Aplosporella prunicola CBS 121167]|uniref:Peptidase M14 domain-containing protein n=1 Tax=Aplosporella prunicola CBS 121167 TaxID=1176127 RepID=A0A6A6BDK4_9PEZI|nr:uncharacterized protein K452DRAFT_298704 [Aplosporella prunicola CBS 121167]KAF2141314.1 hypothetical protein K452DRAFT_298704 [Aplosporella prunicola CBS 121167]